MGLFGRKKEGGGASATRLYYASDIHGSAVLWRKFLNAAAAYKAEVLVMGGDVTGKVVVPLVEREDGFHVDLFGARSVVAGEELERMEQKIRDNGMGIPPQFIKSIFDKFFRVPQGDAQPIKGFGLGLYYVNSIIKKHSGHISVFSERGSGTEFIITLPKYP